MLPSSEIRWLRRGSISVGLLCAFVVLLALPGRHALVEIWPGRIQELVLPDGEVKVIPAREASEQQPVLARTHPETLLTLEFHDGRRDYGYLVRADAETATWWVETLEGLREVDSTTLRRSYAPNDMSLPARLDLMGQRLRERRARDQTPNSGMPVPDERPAESAEGDDL